MASNKNFSILEKVVKKLNSLCFSVSYVCLIAMTLLVVIDITLRSFFASDIPGATEISKYLLVIIGFFGLMIAQASKVNVAVMVLLDRLPSSARHFIGKMNIVIIILFSILFAYSGMLTAISAHADKESDWFGEFILPTWFLRIVVPIGFGFLILQLLTDIREKNGEKPKVHEETRL